MQQAGFVADLGVAFVDDWVFLDDRVRTGWLSTANGGSSSIVADVGVHTKGFKFEQWNTGWIREVSGKASL